MDRGSKRHVLDDGHLEPLHSAIPADAQTRGGRPRHRGLRAGCPAATGSPTRPDSRSSGPAWLPSPKHAHVWTQLENWWLAHPKGANTPNWDIALGCEIEGKPGLILVEAGARVRAGLEGQTRARCRDGRRGAWTNDGWIRAAIAEVQDWCAQVTVRRRSGPVCSTPMNTGSPKTNSPLPPRARPRRYGAGDRTSPGL